MNTKTTAGWPTQLNFDLKPASASQASAATKKGKHMVWMPPATGSHTGGRWVEVDENDSAAAGALNVKRGNAEALRQEQLQHPPGSIPGGGSDDAPLTGNANSSNVKLTAWEYTEDQSRRLRRCWRLCVREQFAADTPESCWPCRARVESASMFIKSLQIGFVGLLLCAANAWAGPAGIQGIVKDAKGQPIKGADVRIESKDGKQLFNTVKTDGKGRYISQGLTPGVYRVTLLVNGAVKGSIMNTKTKPDQATQLNFDLRPVPAAQVNAAEKKGKHMVWMPPATGSHTGGRWVEVSDGASEPGSLNVKRASAEDLQRTGQSMGVPNKP